MIKKFLSILLWLIPISFIAQENQILFKNTNISVDGVLNETIWNELPVNTNFIDYSPENGNKASKQTEVKIFHNGKSLFISAVYHDQESRIQLSSLKRDDLGNTIAFSDSFIMILDTYNQQQSAYYFALNIGGAMADALIERTGESFSLNNSWNAVWNGKVSTQGNKKNYEMEIPLKSFGYDQNNDTWGVIFNKRDVKANEWTTFAPRSRNYRPFDLRFSKQFKIKNLSESKSSRFTLIPSLTVDHNQKLSDKTKETSVTPSLDTQFNLTSSLKLDATFNPDFSQIDVDRQVTNLTRFAINFPERRNFFLENSDLFSNLGIRHVNPFYSRRIGSQSDILFGVKVSGNLSEKTRIGALDVVTKEQNNNPSQNYGALVVQQKLSNSFTTTGFVINRQEMNGFSFLNDFNRILGMNLNYKSKNNKWTGLANYGKSLDNEYNDKNNFYHAGVWYNTLKTNLSLAVHKVDKNYISDVGFVPRLSNYDAINDVVVREGYTHIQGRISLRHYSKERKIIDSYRYLLLDNDNYWNEKGELIQSSFFINNSVWFKDFSSLYINAFYDYNNLQYGFDLLGNGNSIQPGIYKYLRMQLGYNSARNKKFIYRFSLRHGEYYQGKRTRLFSNVEYLMLPVAKLRLTYEANRINLNELGKDTFHLARFTGEVFFSERINWTTYIQYNTQFDNFNVNSRLQWEYKPLSYVYLVVTDNFDQFINRQNWGVALKANYRFDI
ncbi:hypothetical protein SAMN04489761_0402 [Tenacibaculum sp. MAR_2009_124]|uniref:DUF5916 domain-containing protein n=1 Tax=Tenacibaculum sp. MAR_2009_124 TaxID=1250059 RepID=UPI00089A0C41|nr:DUF5916 domain-containing protein [Tenacibaculum sp. MAR_2009_124]SEB39263.1 hypothetical protein SAMN04489761_0402 [Tenacibaculum sp. MAR_2009_124]